ncbi:hypothetical protein ONE63_005704 [Megalurothrips usitatus]|uniref:Mitochondrial import receptor subunit TOM22 homolog n=1 Tax=Megalurothrips usitatus TaxID=439358 RepID=A0AAV7Y0A6_9NEOP|nr:hypothetical protein ONE63_005704 [Megalurothrips usitatus]
MAPGEDVDSGVESLPVSSKDMTPEKPKALPELEDDDEEDLDETLAERLWGLTEMFPDSLRNATYSATTGVQSGVKGFYSFSCSAFWVIFSSSLVLFAPVLLEVERAQMEEQQRNQTKQVLLGPNSAMAAGPPR